MSSKIAFVTGASRGIGKQAALALARKGFDVVITARTLEDGEAHEHGGQQSEISSITGSLATTAREIEALGQRALPIRLDLLDTDSINTAIQQTLDEWGSIDLLLNNGVYQGPGTMSRVMDLDADMMQKVYQGNVFSPLLLIQLVLPAMLQRNSGTIINMVSDSAMRDPLLPTGEGGWGFAYSSSKAALLRLVGVLKAEHKDSSVNLFNVEPGFIVTEMMKEKGMADDFAKQFGGAPPTVPAAVIAWLATAAEARELHGTMIQAQRHCLKLNLLPEWQPKRRKKEET